MGQKLIIDKFTALVFPEHMSLSIQAVAAREAVSS